MARQVDQLLAKVVDQNVQYGWDNLDNVNTQMEKLVGKCDFSDTKTHLPMFDWMNKPRRDLSGSVMHGMGVQPSGLVSNELGPYCE